MIVQIYEIQTPAEAELAVQCGADHVGSVLIAEGRQHSAELKQTVRTAQALGARSSLIPLFGGLEALASVVDRYGPDILHLCESLDGPGGRERMMRLAEVQDALRERFPDLEIMRSIPIREPGRDTVESVLEMLRCFEPVSDFFLTDTLLSGAGNPEGEQPVSGFVGITGRVCDWSIAARLVRASSRPVILAGGLSPDNVAEGIGRVRPAGVDSCTGTNRTDRQGRPIRFSKDMEKVRRFAANARKAARQLSGIFDPPAARP